MKILKAILVCILGFGALFTAGWFAGGEIGRIISKILFED